ncbi:MAG: polysaccharide pyruvyl transferase family protein [Butyribacter sp.]|nr:polysaccharide pyruvyl transferase family protein [bacterium]MDY3853698.1 polysaccharide pyruvyl transferase family protein [Butyribacter sp.]
MSMKKILLLGLEKNTNLGDGVIADCTRYLTEKITKECGIVCQIDSLDMMEDAYDSIPDYDVLIFVGGGIIKYKYQEFYEYIDKITEIADAHNIPVLFNAVGVEGYDASNPKCMQLKKAINRSCVKSITVRDDYDTLRDCYMENPAIVTKKVADPTVWTGTVFRKSKKDSDVIGLGVIREGIFESNGIDIEREKIFALWSGIITQLEKEGKKWKIFTNGWSSDMKFARNLMKYMGREEEIDKMVIKVPEKNEELVETISNFQGVIAGRLHANIISYSLGIPSVGIVWNDKCRLWGETISYPERFFATDAFDAEKIVKQCLQAIAQGYEKTDRDAFANTVYVSLKEALVKALTAAD